MNDSTRRMIFTDRDRELLQALLVKVRLFSLRQIATAWWEGEIANARRRLRQLADTDLATRVTVPARPLPSLERPVAIWRPGQQPPRFGQISYELKNRWTRPVRQCAAWIATPRAANLLGGVGRNQPKNVSQSSHDLGVAAVWLRLRDASPAWAEAWQGEDLWAETRRGQKLPDAFIVGPDGNPVAVIEFGGSYDATRVEAFHNDCAGRGLPYQIW